MNDITVKSRTNHEGGRATTIMLRFTEANSSWRSLVIAVKKAPEITLVAL